MARLEDLSTDPLDDTPRVSAAAQAVLDLALELLDDGDYRWAWDTVSGIRDTIQRTGEASVRQKQALENIRDSRGAAASGEWKRRYEGMPFDDRRRGRMDR